MKTSLINSKKHYLSFGWKVTSGTPIFFPAKTSVTFTGKTSRLGMWLVRYLQWQYSWWSVKQPTKDNAIYLQLHINAHPTPRSLRVLLLVKTGNVTQVTINKLLNLVQAKPVIVWQNKYCIQVISQSKYNRSHHEDSWNSTIVIILRTNAKSILPIYTTMIFGRKVPYLTKSLTNYMM